MTSCPTFRPSIQVQFPTTWFKRVLILIAMFLFSTPAWAHEYAGSTPSKPLGDLVARVVAPVRVEGSPATIFFDIEVSNVGAKQVKGRLLAKPFLLTAVYDKDSAHAPDGFVLPTRMLKINKLDPGGRLQFAYEGLVPQAPKADYLIAVIIDSDDRIHESDEENNVSDLSPAGTFSGSPVSAAPLGAVPSRALDLYPGVSGAVSVFQARAYHTLRTIKSGRGRVNSKSLWARFMAVSLESGKVYTLPYEYDEDTGHVEIEKQFYALFWEPELAADGSRIEVDYYYQDPSVADLPRGEYLFLALLDSHDRFAETNEANNLDITPFTVSPLEFSEYPAAWFVMRQGEIVSAPHVARMSNASSGPISWTASVSSPGPHWLIVDPLSGTIPSGGGFGPSLKAVAAGLSPGEYRADVTFTPTGYENAALSVPARLFIHGQSAPVIAVSKTDLHIITRQEVHPPTEEFEIRNTGDAILKWEVQPDQGWLSVGPLAGELAPGMSQRIAVQVHPEGLTPTYYETYEACILISSNARDGHVPVMVELEIT